MNPAFSVISFTLVAGAAQGLVVALAGAALAGVPAGRGFGLVALGLALAMLAAGLGASFLHLGRPERAWRAAAMWRTSWLSREVIVLPVFMALVALWWAMLWFGGAGAVGAPAGAAAPTAASQGLAAATPALLAAAAVLMAALLWLCTAQIYACLRFIQEWAHPLTLVNYTLIGLASGCVLACALAASLDERALLAAAAPWALTLTFVAWAGRCAALLRNAGLKAKSTAQSATGIRSARLVQKSMGMSAGAFNTREFFHRASALAVQRVRWALHGLGFALPAALMVAAAQAASAHPGWWWAALASQVPGLLAERWLFFAQARHPQNLYYQTVS
jgi:DMSO reductase anchor subunit